MTLPIPVRHRPALVLAAVLLGLLLDWVGVAGPRCAALGASRARLAALRIEVGAARREVATRADTKRAVRTAARALRRAAARLPDQRELAVLLASVADGARDARLELLRLHPKPERPAGDHVEVPVELEMRGTYPAAREFLRRLDALGRLVRVGDLILERPQRVSNQVVVQIRCVAITYRLPVVAEQRAARVTSADDHG
jgi:Tfp pilus assembly protein PilO